MTKQHCIRFRTVSPALHLFIWSRAQACACKKTSRSVNSWNVRQTAWLVLERNANVSGQNSTCLELARCFEVWAAGQIIREEKLDPSRIKSTPCGQFRQLHGTTTTIIDKMRGGPAILARFLLKANKLTAFNSANGPSGKKHLNSRVCNCFVSCPVADEFRPL